MYWEEGYMRLEQISYFLSVAEHGNITAAARSLYISQPALSKQITLLEQEIGLPLFERQARGVTLTRAGVQFQKDLKNILKELENAKKNAVLAGRAKKPLLNVGCFDGVYADDFLPALYEYLREAAPGQKLVLHKCNFVEGNEYLRKGKIDLWLTLGPSWEQTDGFLKKELAYRKGALIYSARSLPGKKEHPTWEDFREEPCIVIKKSQSPTMFQHSMDTLEMLGLDTELIELVENIGTELSYVKLGRGYCLLSKEAIQGSRELRSIPLPEERGVEVVAVWPEENEELTALMEAYHSQV